jgi:molybdopterin molybdotransferase
MNTENAPLFPTDYDPDTLPVAQARELIHHILAPLRETESVALKEALGRVLAEDVISPLDVPAHDNSAMDGYGVRLADLRGDGPWILRVAGTALAGQPFTGRIAAGECLRIMTGAMIPPGIDAVVMQERVEATESGIRLSACPRAGENLRRAGEDLRQGEVALATGRRLTPADLGLIGSLGLGTITVFRRLRVAFFSTGDEVASIGEPLKPGQIYDSNRYTLYGMLTRIGAEPLDLGRVEDAPEKLEAALLEAARKADVIITSGGVSVGEADYVKALLAKLGEVMFWKIAMKPGRPLACGRIGQAFFFGLPGNPVSVMVTFYEFVQRALQILQGEPDPDPAPSLSLECTSRLRKLPGRTEFQRGIMFQNEKGEWRVRATGNQGSGILRSMCQANCFIVLGADQRNVEPGDEVIIQPFHGLT